MSVVPAVYVDRVHPVIAGVGVDEDHSDGRVPLRRIGHGATVMATQVRANPVAQRVVVGDRHRSTINRPVLRNIRWALAGLPVSKRGHFLSSSRATLTALLSFAEQPGRVRSGATL